MKLTKKFFSAVIAAVCALTVCFASIPAGVSAESVVVNNVTYKTYDDHVEVTKCDSNATSVSVLKEVYNFPVTTIAENAFKGCSALTDVTIPASVTSIGYAAFYECSNLESITILNPDCNISNDEKTISDTAKMYVIENSTAFDYAKTYNRRFDFVSNAVEPEVKPPVTTGNEDSSDQMKEIGVKVGDVECEAGETVRVPLYIFGTSKCTSVYFDVSVSAPLKIRKIIGALVWEQLADNKCGAVCMSGSGYSDSKLFSEIEITIPDDTEPGIYPVDIEISLMEDNGADVEMPVGISGKITVAEPEPSDPTEHLTYKKIDKDGDGVDDYIMIIDCDESAVSVEIPSEIDGLPVIKIGGSAFEYCFGLTSIKIPDSVTEIGEKAFCGCIGLKSIEIPDSVTYIGSYAFFVCESLTNIEIPNSITSIEWYAFSGCTSLASVVIPNGVTYIGHYAFEACTGLTSIEIPDSVTSIGRYAFSGCTSLASVVIPNSVTKIEDAAFSACTSLTNVTIPDSVTYIGEFAFSDCASLTSIEIPDSVTYFGDRAFRDCTDLRNIEIPDSVTEIGYEAFFGCTSLTSIEIPDSVTYIGKFAFSDCTRLISINVSENNRNYSSLEGILFNKDKTKLIQYPAGINLTEYVIPDSVTSIVESAFSGCTALISVVIPDGVTEIEKKAFSGCESLTSVAIPDSVTSIEYSTFENCTALTSVVIPDSVTEIGEKAFSGTPFLNNQTGVKYAGKFVIDCDNDVTTAEIKSGTKGIAGSAFYECTDLTSIEIPNSVTSIGNHAFSGCEGLTSIVIPDSVTSIGINAFSGTPFLNNQTGVKYAGKWVIGCDEDVMKAEIKFGTKGIAVYAFGGCYSLESIEIPDSVTYIEDDAFGDCKSLTSIEIPNSVTSIGGYAFRYCRSLTSIEIPESVISIGEYAFLYCTSLKSIEIPDSVTEIGEGAFYDCSDLTNITIPDSVTSIWEYVFSGCTSLESIEIPDSVTSIGSSAFKNCKSLTRITIKNPECEIYNDSDTICNGYDNGEYYFNGTIYGYENSTAQDYAKEYGYTFKEIGSEPSITTTLPTTTTTSETATIATAEATTMTTAAIAGITVPTGVTATKYGDVNLDEEINISDVVAINLFMLNQKAYPLEDKSIANADCVKDNVINASDSTILMNYASEIIDISELGK